MHRSFSTSSIPFARFVVAAALSLAFALYSPPAGTIEASPAPATIRVLAQDSSIRYGKAIDLTLRLESDAADITSIKTFYRPQGTRTITTYGYADFTPGRQVTARLTIPTATPTYYPPGVVFEVHYEVADAAGNRIETEPQVIEYLDPGFTWKRLSRANFTVIYHDRQESAVNDLLATVSGRIPGIESTVGADVMRASYRAILFNSNAEARRAFPFVSQAATDGHVFAGFAYEQYGLFVLDHAGVPGVTHELTHLIFGGATNTPTAKRPAWLNEGLSVYFETGSRTSTAARLRDAIRDDRLLPVRAMNSIPGRPDQIDVFYPQAGNFVGFLIERHGEERMRALVSELRGGTLPGEAVLAAYGASLEALEAGWRADIGAKVAPPLPVPTPIASGPSGSGEPAAEPTRPTGGQPQPQLTPTASGSTAEPAPAPGDTPGPVEQIEEGRGSPSPSLTIWWSVAGLVVAAAASAVIYFVRRTRRGAP